MRRDARGAIAALELLLAASLAACGGGGGGSSPAAPPGGSSGPTTPSVAGVAAAGSPLVDGIVVLIDANGVRLTVAVAADGHYSFDDVSGLKAPFVLRAMGSVGGQVVVLHAPVVAADLNGGKVNVNPLTEMITATLLGGTPDTLIDRNTADLSLITSAAVSSATASVKALVQPVLAAVPGADVDARTASMSADHLGLDLALDALNVTLTDKGYLVATSAGGSGTQFDTNAPGNAAPVAFTADQFSKLSAASARLPALKARLSELSALFANGMPSATALQPFFSADFQDAGLTRDAFIDDLRDPTAVNLAGASFDDLCIVQVVDADNIVVRFRIKPADSVHVRPWEQRSRMVRSANQWLLRGDGELARASVNLMSRIVATPMTEVALAALPRVKTISVSDGAGGLRTAYQREIFDANNALVETLWLAYPGDPSFGLHGWSSKDQFAMPGGKAWRSTYQEYYGGVNTQVRQYLMINVPTKHVSAAVASVLVTGPGLPSGGLKLLPPTPSRPRPNWVFAGDSFDWNAFDTGRCAQVDNATNPVPNCALDISKIDAGAEYIFTLRAADGTVLGALRPRLPAKPRTPAELFTRRDELFPRFQLAPEQYFSYHNLFDDSGAFAVGKSLTLNWKLPTAKKSSLASVSFFVEYPDSLGVSRDASDVRPLYTSGVMPTAAAFTVPSTPTSYGAWATLVGFDHFGNEYQHEVSPDNPY